MPVKMINAHCLEIQPLPMVFPFPSWTSRSLSGHFSQCSWVAGLPLRVSNIVQAPQTNIPIKSTHILFTWIDNFSPQDLTLTPTGKKKKSIKNSIFSFENIKTKYTLDTLCPKCLRSGVFQTSHFSYLIIFSYTLWDTLEMEAKSKNIYVLYTLINIAWKQFL